MNGLVALGSEEAARTLSKHTLPLALKPKAANLAWDDAERATFTLLHAGARHVFVTCFHVLKRLRELRQLDPSAQLVAYAIVDHGLDKGLAEINTFYLVDESEALDVAVFRGLADTVSIPGHEFIDYRESYLTDPQGQEAVSIVGYPGANISLTPALAALNYMQIVFAASCVSERRITLADESGLRKYEDYANPPRPENPSRWTKR